MIFNIFIVIYEIYHNLLHLTYGYKCCCLRVLIHWMAEVFTAPIQTNITITFFSPFSDVLEVFRLPLISYALKVFLSSYIHAVVTLILSNYSDCIALLTCPIVSLVFPFVSLTPDLTYLVRNRTCLLNLIRLLFYLIRNNWSWFGSLWTCLLL